MIPFIFDNEKIFLPESWDEITVQQFFKLRKAGEDYCAVLEALSGLSRDKWFTTHQTDIDLQVAPHLTWMQDITLLALFDLPQKITIAGKEWEVPKDLGLKTFGQKLTLQKEMMKCLEDKKDLLDCLSLALAVYFQPLVQEKEFNFEEAQKLMTEIDKCKITEAYPVGNFFLKKFFDSWKGIPNFSKKTRHENNDLQVLTN